MIRDAAYEGGSREPYIGCPDFYWRLRGWNAGDQPIRDKVMERVCPCQRRRRKTSGSILARKCRNRRWWRGKVAARRRCRQWKTSPWAGYLSGQKHLQVSERRSNWFSTRHKA